MSIAGAIENVRFAIPLKSEQRTDVGSIILTTPSQLVQAHEIQQFCSQWGSVTRVMHVNTSPGSFVVEFHHRIAAETAERDLSGLIRWGGALTACLEVGVSDEIHVRTNLFQQFLAEQRTTQRQQHDRCAIDQITNSLNTMERPSMQFFRNSPQPMSSQSHLSANNPWAACFTTGLGLNMRSVHPIPAPAHNHRGLSSFQQLPVQPIAVPSRSASFNAPSTKRSGHRSGESRPSGRNDQGSGEYCLSIENVRSGLDKRTTLMIRNIPNKYTQHMLLSEINERHKVFRHDVVS